MNELMKILKECCPDVDFEVEKKLVSAKVIDSIELVDIISEIEVAFDVRISVEVLNADNFDSAEKIWNMIQRLKRDY